MTSEQGQATGDATKVRGQTYLIAGEILDLLAELVNKSLVVADRTPGRETRYELHETIRQYAWNKLKEVGEARPVQERHADYYGRILESALPRFFYDDRVVLHRNWLEAEMENWRAVMVPSSWRFCARPPSPSTSTTRLGATATACLLYTSPSPRDRTRSRMPSSA